MEANKCANRSNLRLAASRNNEVTWSSIFHKSFEVPIKINFKGYLNMDPLKTTHTLNFQNEVTLTNQMLCFNNTKIQKAIKAKQQAAA